MGLRRVIQCLKARREQNFFDCSSLYTAKKIIVYLLPPKEIISGGVLSIFNLCETTRKIVKDAEIVLATFPSFYTYSRVSWFDNNEKIYRFSQIICKKIHAYEAYIHIPEYISHKFYLNLSQKQKNILKNIKSLHINIMNQNIELMPEYGSIRELFLLTKNVTQTTAHDRYANQEVCNKWKIPLHHFSVNTPVLNIKPMTFEEKIKNITIVFSNDKNEYKEKICDKIINNVTNCKIITICNMSYREYCEIICKSLCVITFGEGFDAYFIQPFFYETIGIAVYNDIFFPSEKWKNTYNVYSSFDELELDIVNFINNIVNDKYKYYKIIDINKKMFAELYSYEKYKNNIQRFYQGNYDFMPNNIIFHSYQKLIRKKCKIHIASQGYCWSGSSAVIQFLSEFSNTTVIAYQDNIYSKEKQTGGQFGEIPFFWQSSFIRFIKSFESDSIVYRDGMIKKFIQDIYKCYDTKGSCWYEKNPFVYTEEFLNISLKLLYSVLELDGYTIQFMKDKRFPVIFNSYKSFPFDKCCFMKESCLKRYIFYKFKNITQEDFDIYVKQFVEGFLGLLDSKDFLVSDQMFAGATLEILDKYLGDYPIKQIGTYRDPRDQFLAWFRCDTGLSRTVDEFVNFYKITTVAHLKSSYKNRLMVRFEDLVLKYEETTQKIMDFCGIDPATHVRPKAVFDPAISVINIGGYKDFIDQDFMRQIEEQLGEYCYYPEKENLSEEAWNLLKSVGRG